MRAFIAIELPTEIKNYLSSIQNKLKAELPKVSWVKLENLHLTLKFLGEISPKQFNEIKQIITEITKGTSEFKIKLESAGVFPNPTVPRLIWIGNNQASTELKQLTEQLNKRLAESDIPQDERIFHAHITIGRIKTRLNSSDLKEALDKTGGDLVSVNEEFNCKEITLFESTLGPGGPTYKILEKFKIA